MECNCDICQAKRDNVHPWEYLYPKDSNRRKLIHRDFLADKMQPIWHYDQSSEQIEVVPN